MNDGDDDVDDGYDDDDTQRRGRGRSPYVHDGNNSGMWRR